jgi:cytoplasmic iron level regulating protein YaaA (DUF328/UPF0246 family)
MDTPRGSNLYQYWGDGITRQIDEEMAIHAGGNDPQASKLNSMKSFRPQNPNPQTLKP